MRRRNLIVTSDSDKEDDAATTASASVASGGRHLPQNPSPYPAPSPPFPSSPPPSPPIEISDDEEEEFEEIQDPDGDPPFADALEDLSPPLPPPPARTPTLTPIPPLASAPAPAPPPPARTPTPTPPPARTPTPTPLPASTPPSALSGRLRSVDEFLRNLGLRLRPEWLELFAAGVPGFDGLGGMEAQARRCFEQFLFADMNACGAGVLPEGVGSMHAAVLDGPFVLQVDEIVNMSAPLRERYHDAHAGPKRCLKLSMTDGIQRIYGMEYRPIKDLEVLAPAGFKIVIRNVHIRRGLLMLVPEAIEILWGVADELEAARERLVSEVNKPPRGKRKQGGLPLSSRASLAAWPCKANVANGGEQGILMPRTVNPSHPTGLGNASQVCRTTGTVVEEHVVVNPPVVLNGVREQTQHVQEITMQDLSTTLTRNNTEAPASGPYRYVPQHSTGRTTRIMVEEYVDHPIVANNVHEQIQRVQEITMQDQATAFTRNRREPSASTPLGYDSQHRPHDIGDSGTAANDVVAARSLNGDDEIDQMEHPITLSGENEKPFTYIINMIADWGAEEDTRPYIQGKIKGLITCVKRFQFKNCTEYELHVYIDDGSYISEAFVDCDIVRNMIGHSPEEVTAALYSGDPKSASAMAMKEILKGFQHVLVKFEGTMIMEFNRNCSVPIVREMNEGCSSSDAWLLLRRMKTFSSARHMRSLDFMDTTP